MGIRFRRSITIAPGIRLNVGRSGASISVGPRGASVSLGSRGIYGNVGVPGTGLSYRQRFDSAGSKVARRNAYRTTLKEARAAERAAMQDAALDEHHASEERFTRITSILRDRVREPYDWEGIWRSRGPFEPEPFRTPVGPSDRPHSSDRVDPPGATQWLLAILGLTLVSQAFGGFSARIASLALLAGAIAWAVVAQRQFRNRSERARHRRAAELENDVSELESHHHEIQEDRRKNWDTDEEIRGRIYSAPADGNLEIICDVLEAELANEDIPIPLVFDLSMTSPDAVQIELSLPELEEVPLDRTRITKTGKLSRKALTQAERTSIYVDLCAGLALRLVHETLRIVPTVDRIEVLGTTQRPDPQTGHQEEIIGLHLGVSRAQVMALDLDALDPSAALSGLGGAFACDRRGVVSPLPGVEAP